VNQNMAVRIGSRISTPGDWREYEPGHWEVKVTKTRGGKTTVEIHVAHGNTQCVICGEPIQATPGESDKCNECFHVLANYLQGMKISKAYEKRINEWRKEGDRLSEISKLHPRVTLLEAITRQKRRDKEMADEGREATT